MPAPRVPIVETVLKAWIDAFHAIRAMPLVAAVALVILAAVGVAAWWLSVAVLLSPGRTVDQWLDSPTWFVLSVLNSGLQIVLLAPLAIAVQRFVIRGDVAKRYPLDPLRPSYLHFVGMAIAIYLAYRAPQLINILMPASIGLWLLTPVLTIAVMVVASRKIALFPAIAVYAPNATWRGVASTDEGNTFRIVLILFVIWLPGAVYSWLVTFHLPIPRTAYDMGGSILALAVWLPQLPIIAAFAAAAARIYMALSEPAAVATQAESPSAA